MKRNGKLLIVGNDPISIQYLRTECKEFGFSQILACRYRDAVEVFQKEKPGNLAIIGYDEENIGGGKDTWEELLEKGLIDGQIVVLLGHEDCDVPCYRKLPASNIELKKAFFED